MSRECLVQYRTEIQELESTLTKYIYQYWQNIWHCWQLTTWLVFTKYQATALSLTCWLLKGRILTEKWGEDVSSLQPPEQSTTKTDTDTDNDTDI